MAWIWTVMVQAPEVFGVRLVGVTPENGRKLVLTVGAVVALIGAGRLVGTLVERLVKPVSAPVAFWARQGIRLLSTVALVLMVVSIWFDDPTRLATGLGLVTAGLAFALQRVVTAIAGYFVILQGKTFNVGDRITMGGVRGDVIALGFTQTTIMEMGQPPAVQNADPAMWLHSRQYTGRIVTVTNAKIFDEPVYNYTRDFPYIWEELALPVSYESDPRVAEQILLAAAERHSVRTRELGAEALAEMGRRYFMRQEDLHPAVFWRITDNWLELTVRFVVPDHGIRAVKDAMARDILGALDAAGIEIASATYDVVKLPTVQVRLAPPEAGR